MTRPKRWSCCGRASSRRAGLATMATRSPCSRSTCSSRSGWAAGTACWPRSQANEERTNVEDQRGAIDVVQSWIHAARGETEAAQRAIDTAGRLAAQITNPTGIAYSTIISPAWLALSEGRFAEAYDLAIAAAKLSWEVFDDVAILGGTAAALLGDRAKLAEIRRIYVDAGAAYLQGEAILGVLGAADLALDGRLAEAGIAFSAASDINRRLGSVVPLCLATIVRATLIRPPDAATTRRHRRGARHPGAGCEPWPGSSCSTMPWRARGRWPQPSRRPGRRPRRTKRRQRGRSGTRVAFKPAKCPPGANEQPKSMRIDPLSGHRCRRFPRFVLLGRRATRGSRPRKTELRVYRSCRSSRLHDRPPRGTASRISSLARWCARSYRLISSGRKPAQSGARSAAQSCMNSSCASRRSSSTARSWWRSSREPSSSSVPAPSQWA